MDIGHSGKPSGRADTLLASPETRTPSCHPRARRGGEGLCVAGRPEVGRSGAEWEDMPKFDSHVPGMGDHRKVAKSWKKRIFQRSVK